MSVDQASVGQIDDAEDESLSCLLADLDEVCDRFEVAWRSGEPPLIEDSLKDVPEPLRPFFLRELVALDVAYRRQVGQTPCRAEYEQRFQQHARAVREAFGGDGDGAITPVYHLAEARRLAEPAIASGRLEVRCPHCRAPMHVDADSSLTDLTCESCGSRFSLVDQGEQKEKSPPLSQLGRFEIIERLGIGSFGSVWKARDNELDRTVAIKIPRQGSMTAEEQERFFLEARAAAQLRHPNIVSIHEVGRDGDSVYIVSDFVHGVTLDDWLTDQQLTSREAAELCATIADALHHAHEAGVVHRDLKPGNILIDGDMDPHLVDFGLARRDAGEVTITMDGQLLGTPAYMSPEQARGEAHQADRRSDVYSLGVIFFQLLTGERPFRGSARMLVHQVINDEPPSPRKLNSVVPRDLETITLKCLEKDSAKRYHTAREVADELRRYLAGEPIHARSIGPLSKLLRWSKRRPAVAALSLLVLATAIGGPLIAIRQSQLVRSEKTARQEVASERQRFENLTIAQEALLYTHDMAKAKQASDRGEFDDVERLVDRYATSPRLTGSPKFEYRYLRHLLDVKPIADLGDRIADLAISDDSERIAAITEHGNVVVLSRNSGEGDRSFWPRVPPDSRRQIALSADGALLAVAAHDALVVLDAQTGAPRKELTGHHGLVDELRFTGPTQVTALSFQGEATQWDVTEGKLVDSYAIPPWETITQDGYSDRCGAISPDGTMVAIGNAFRGVHLYSLVEHKKLAKFDNMCTQSSLSFSADGKTLVGQQGTKGIVLWDCESFAETLVNRSSEPAPYPETRLYLLPNGLIIGQDKMISDQAVLAAMDGGGNCRLRRLLAALDDDVAATCLSSRGDLLAAGTVAGSIYLHDLRRLLPFTARDQSEQPFRGTEWTADGKQLLIHQSEELPLLLDVSTRTAVRIGDTACSAGHYCFPECSDDGRYCAWLGADLVLYVWDLNENSRAAEFHSRPGNWFARVAFSPADSRILACGMSDSEINIFDVVSKERLRKRWAGTWPSDLKFTHDGRVLAIGGPDACVVWNWQDDTEKAFDPPATHLAFSADDKSLFYVGKGTATLIRDMDQGQAARVVAHSSLGRSAAFLDEGQRLLSGDERELRIWDSDSLNCVWTEAIAQDKIVHAVLSPDETALAVVRDADIEILRAPSLEGEPDRIAQTPSRTIAAVDPAFRQVATTWKLPRESAADTYATLHNSPRQKRVRQGVQHELALAEAAYRCGEYDESLASLRRAITNTSGDAYYGTLLSTALFKTTNLGEGRELAQTLPFLARQRWRRNGVQAPRMYDDICELMAASKCNRTEMYWKGSFRSWEGKGADFSNTGFLWHRKIGTEPIGEFATDRIELSLKDEPPTTEMDAGPYATVASSSCQLQGGAYLFVALSDEGLRLRVEDTQVINHWEGHEVTLDTGLVRVAAGEHRFKLEHYEISDGATLYVDVFDVTSLVGQDAAPFE